MGCCYYSGQPRAHLDPHERLYCCPFKPAQRALPPAGLSFRPSPGPDGHLPDELLAQSERLQAAAGLGPHGRLLAPQRMGRREEGGALGSSWRQFIGLGIFFSRDGAAALRSTELLVALGTRLLLRDFVEGRWWWASASGLDGLAGRAVTPRSRAFLAKAGLLSSGLSDN